MRVLFPVRDDFQLFSGHVHVRGIRYQRAAIYMVDRSIRSVKHL
jgi:hypothetical protein